MAKSIREDIIVAGFGGQGVLLTGKLLSIAAMSAGYYVMSTPSYGAEVRGGTTKCNIIISTDVIYSPIITVPSILLAFNEPSLSKFESSVQKGGLLVYNSSLINRKPARTDIESYAFPAVQICRDLHAKKAVNMAFIGKLLQLRPDLLSIDQVAQAMDHTVSARNRHFNEKNIKVMNTVLELAG